MNAETQKVGLMNLRRRHEEYMIAWRQSGKPTRNYETPCCGKEIETTAPSNDETWDSLTTCPWCGDLHMKVVTRHAVRTARVGGAA
jgi:hypothetical protein